MRGLKYLAAILAVATLAVPVVTVAKEKPPAEWDGLERRTNNKKLDNLYVRPNVTFKAYKRVSLGPVEVKFDKDWDPNSGTRGVSNRLSKEDIEKIRTGLSALFREEFSKRLGNAGYPVVEESGDDVLHVEAALVNLYVNAPETMSSSVTRSYTMDAGRVTLVMELADSVTRQALARVVDTQQGMDTGRMT